MKLAIVEADAHWGPPTAKTGDPVQLVGHPEIEMSSP